MMLIFALPPENPAAAASLFIRIYERTRVVRILVDALLRVLRVAVHRLRVDEHVERAELRADRLLDLVADRVHAQEVHIAGGEPEMGFETNGDVKAAIAPKDDPFLL